MHMQQKWAPFGEEVEGASGDLSARQQQGQAGGRRHPAQGGGPRAGCRNPPRKLS